MSTRLDKRGTYEESQLTGISRRCDWFMNGAQLLKKNDIPKTIFLSAQYGYNTVGIFIDNILPIIIMPVIIVVASEDVTFPTGAKDLRANAYADIQDKVWQLINHPLVTRIYVENLDTIHPKLTPIPLGIHPVWEQSYLDQMNSAINPNTDRPILAYCNCRLRADAQHGDRVTVTALATNEWASFVEHTEELPLELFKQKMLNAKFTICVHGGGIDPSPRAWEALLCGSIPIIQHSTLDEAYSRFPVFYVDEWTSDAISEDKLNAWWLTHTIDRQDVLRKLSLDYWWSIISSGQAEQA